MTRYKITEYVEATFIFTYEIEAESEAEAEKQIDHQNGHPDVAYTAANATDYWMDCTQDVEIEEISEALADATKEEGDVDCPDDYEGNAAHGLTRPGAGV